MEGINGPSRKKALFVGNTCRSGWRCNFDGVYWLSLCMRKQEIEDVGPNSIVESILCIYHVVLDSDLKSTIMAFPGWAGRRELLTECLNRTIIIPPELFITLPCLETSQTDSIDKWHTPFNRNLLNSVGEYYKSWKKKPLLHSLWDLEIPQF